MDDFELAKDKVLMGTERRSMVMSEEERRTAAWHEAGHTLVGKLVEGNDAVHKVSIIPRGAALGVTQFLPTEDRHLMTKQQTLARIAMALGGRVAEEIVFERADHRRAGRHQARHSPRPRHGLRVRHERASSAPSPTAKTTRASSSAASLLRAARTTPRTRRARSTRRCARIVEEQYVVARRHPHRQPRQARPPRARAARARDARRRGDRARRSRASSCRARERVIIPTWAEKQKAQKTQKRPASIFGAPKPAPG